jgi:hypothetical protein
MAIELKAPAFPESVADGEIAAWHRKTGLLKKSSLPRAKRSKVRRYWRLSSPAPLPLLAHRPLSPWLSQ